MSDDINFAQRFSDAGLVELVRYLLDAQQNVDTTPGYESMGVGTETPQRRAYVLGGVRFEPLAGSTSSVISPGTMLFVDNPGATLDSIATLIEDPGLQTLGILTLSPGGGATRIDVVECQPYLSLEQSDNRDIFNPTTGLFTPTTVPKVRMGKLNYRIRQGTAGGGFPGLAAGWVPIAVCSVPAAATTWDAVTVWDVRPLVSELVDGPFQNIRARALPSEAEISADVATAGQVRLYGYANATYRQWKAGGLLSAQGVPYVDVRANANRAGNFAGFPTVAFSRWTLYALFPFGLPRWVQYSSTAPRVPTGQRGILAVTTVPPTYAGNPSAVINTPTGFGLIDTPSTAGVALLSGRCDSAGVPIGVSITGHKTSFVNADVEGLSPSATTTTSADWTLVAGQHFPPNARAVLVRVRLIVDINHASGSILVTGELRTTVSEADGAIAYAKVLHEDGSTWHVGELSADRTITHEYSAEVPLPNDRNGAIATRTFLVRAAHNVVSVQGGLGTIAVQNTSTLRVVGWEI